MERIYQTENVSNARVNVRTANLATSEPENVIMGVIITGLESFVKVR